VTSVYISSDSRGVWFGIADGAVYRGECHGGFEPKIVARLDCTLLSMIEAPHGGGALIGGDDGCVYRIGADGTSSVLAHHPGRWVENLVAHAEVGIIGFSAGKSVHVLSTQGGHEAICLEHSNSVSGIAINPPGKRLAASHYDGVSLWWLGARERTPKKLNWRGSHIAVSWSPDGRFLVTATQENELHGWRLADGMDMAMSGYAAKPRSMSWTRTGRYLVTSGAPTLTCWNCAGAGPMGSKPIELGEPTAAMATVVACHPRKTVVAAGFDHGQIAVADIELGLWASAMTSAGDRVTAIAWAPVGDALAFGTESGLIGLLAVNTKAA